MRALFLRGLSPDSACSFSLVFTLPALGGKEQIDPHEWLSAEEFLRYKDFGLRRRHDFLLGRRAAKLALRHSCPQYQHPPSITISNDPSGRPFFSGKEELRSLQLSLAHDSAGAVSLVSYADSPLGIDVEKINRKVSRLEALRHMISPQERSLTQKKSLASMDETETLYRIWCLKEAWGKAWGTGLAAPYSRLRLSFLAPIDHPDYEGLLLASLCDEEELLGWSFRAGEFCLAVVGPICDSIDCSVTGIQGDSSRHYSLTGLRQKLRKSKDCGNPFPLF